MLATTWPATPVVDIFSTLVDRTALRPTGAVIVIHNKREKETSSNESPNKKKVCTNLENNFILDLPKLGLGYRIVQIPAAQVGEDSHAGDVLVSVDQPSFYFYFYFF